MSVLLVAASGGHLAQLDRLAPRIPGVDSESVWVTFDTAQARSLLADRPHVFIPFIDSRGFGMALRNIPVAARIIRQVRPSLVVSTGNAIAASFLPAARVAGLPAAYIESAARAEGPSLTGRLMERVPGLQLFTQYQSWADSRWSYVGSVFDTFASKQLRDERPPNRAVVTLGTRGFGFRRLIERVLHIMPAHCEVVWQVGGTDVSGLGIEASTDLPTTALDREFRRADVVIAHAGIGSALAALDAGRSPVLVPREMEYGECVDDHQRQIANTLDRLGLATGRAVSTLDVRDLQQSAARQVLRRGDLPPLSIVV